MPEPGKLFGPVVAAGISSTYGRILLNVRAGGSRWSLQDKRPAALPAYAVRLSNGSESVDVHVIPGAKMHTTQLIVITPSKDATPEAMPDLHRILDSACAQAYAEDTAYGPFMERDHRPRELQDDAKFAEGAVAWGDWGGPVAGELDL